MEPTDNSFKTVNHLVLGDPRSNQNPALLAFSILWYRWHNIVAAAVQQEHTDWPDEEVFQRTRRIVVATLQVSSEPPAQNQPHRISTRGYINKIEGTTRKTYIFDRKLIEEIYILFMFVTSFSIICIQRSIYFL